MFFEFIVVGINNHFLNCVFKEGLLSGSMSSNVMIMMVSDRLSKSYCLLTLFVCFPRVKLVQVRFSISTVQ